MPQIIDVIIIEAKPAPSVQFDQIFLVLDSMPNFLYERRGNNLVASDDGFYQCYTHDEPSKHYKAFGGDRFDIPMKDGSAIKAHGQWWWASPQEHTDERLVDVGIATIEKLQRCYVFGGGFVSRTKLDEWLRLNTPSDNYHKYDKKCCIA